MPLLPKSDNADYKGSILSAYAVALVGLLWIVPGAIHAFLPDGVTADRRSLNMNRYAMKQTIPVLLAIFFLTLPFSAQAKLVEYEFDIDYKTVNFSGEEKRAMSVGGSIPAPTIEATVGDTLRVTFHNKMDVESSIHWHGILLPNEQDGVPYLTTSPIKAGTSFTFEYPVIHHGTYWYHSHTLSLIHI